MKSVIIRSLTVFLAMAAAITLPTTVKAQADSLSQSTAAATSKEQLNTEADWCYPLPGYGLRCG